jgi:hypothetical protein
MKSSALPLLATLFVVNLFSASAAAGSNGPATLEIDFLLTDLERRPIPGASVRLVFGAQPGWQSALAGHRFTTDAKGGHTFAAPVAIEARAIRWPTNFVSSLFRRAEPADFLQLGAELDYAGHRWLYVIDVHRFRSDGTVMRSGFSVFTRNARGDFTEKANVTDVGWAMADMNGLVLAEPGHRIADLTLLPVEGDEGTSPRWRLTVSFTRSPVPMSR